MTAYSSLLVEYLGEGVAASRPATLNIPPGSLGLYYATDTSILSIWNAVTPGWDTTLSPNITVTDGTTTVTNVTSFTFQSGGVVTNAGLGVVDIAGPIYRAQIPLTSVQLLALHTAPVTIVAAPGAGKAVVFLGGALSFTAGGAVYNSTGNDEGLYYGSTSNQVTFALSAVLTSAVDEWSILLAAPSPPTDPTLVENTAIRFYGPTANMTVGTGTGKLTFLYALVDI